jgi:hypothetical protein
MKRRPRWQFRVRVKTSVAGNFFKLGEFIPIRLHHAEPVIFDSIAGCGCGNLEV